MTDLVTNIIGEYTLMCLILIVVSVFLYNFVPPIRLQWRFVILAITSLVLAHYLPPDDNSAYGYAFVIAGVVSYKGILMDELRLISSLAKKYNDPANAVKKEEENKN